VCLVVVLGEEFNFTSDEHQPLVGGWGIDPDPPDDYLNGTFTGVLGGVVNKEHDYSGSTWLWNLDRNPR